jgi:hypothetical protein
VPQLGRGVVVSAGCSERDRSASAGSVEPVPANQPERLTASHFGHGGTDSKDRFVFIRSRSLLDAVDVQPFRLKRRFLLAREHHRKSDPAK